jgi:glutaconyl-CoA/methylmalonyl-CoA decarboxylase subunit gamma
VTQERTLTLTVAGKQYRVNVGDVSNSPVRVVVNDREFWVEIAAEHRSSSKVERAPAEPDEAVARSHPPPAVPVRQPAASPRQVTAPMPGNVVDVQVRSGQTVAAGAVLCYLEAMKMKNAIHAPGTGTVAEIMVSEGQPVEYGQVLLTFQDESGD